MAKKTKPETASVVVPEAEQPYKIPDNWRWVTIRGINCYCPHTVDPAKQPDACFELYSVPSMETDYPEIVHSSEIGSSKQSVQKNDVLLCKINPHINRVWKVSKYTDYELLASSEWVVIRNNRLDPDFIVYCLKSPYFREFMLSHVSGMGGSLMRAQPKYVTSYPIPLPPLAEQQRIVDRIESLFTALDEVRERVQAALDGLELYRGAVLREAFDGTLTAAWRQENGLDISSWRTQTLKECCKISSGGTPSRKKPEYYKGNIPWVKTGEINWNEIADADERITESAVADSSAKLNPAGAVLVAMYGMGLTRGRAAILKVPAATNQAVCVLQPNSDVLNWYLFYYFMRNYWQIRAQAVGGNQLNLSGKIISQLQISIPTLDEQRKIVDTLHSLLKKAREVKETAETVSGQIELMKKIILARAFRGELGTNDPSEASPDFAVTVQK